MDQNLRLQTVYLREKETEGDIDGSAGPEWTVKLTKKKELKKCVQIYLNIFENFLNNFTKKFDILKKVGLFYQYSN